MLGPLGHLNGIISAFLCNLSACCLPSSFCSRKYMHLKMMMFGEFQDGCLVLGSFWYANGMILATSESPCCMKPVIKFLFKRIYGLEDVGWSIQKWLFSARQSFICKSDDLSYIWVSMMTEAFHQVFAQEDIWFEEDVGWRIPRWLFSAWSSLICE